MTDSNSPLQYQPTPVGNAKAYEEILRTSIIQIADFLNYLALRHNVYLSTLDEILKKKSTSKP